ncbi:MAG: pyridoxamine 5'-phosphate oxidase family protein [Methanosphaera sp.]|nr:pyridoxamine 5'-phosphate oxidase family protein [Methanosphaera sp.]
MFRKMRRNKQELSNKECIQILENQQRGFLAVSGENEYPYTLPMNYVYYDKKIIFHSAREGHKIDSIKKHEKVSFSVINEGEKVENDWYYIFKSVIVFGKIRIIQDEKEKYEKLTILGDKYFPSKEYTKMEMDAAFDQALVLELEIDHMTGKIVTEK